MCKQKTTSTMVALQKHYSESRYKDKKLLYVYRLGSFIYIQSAFRKSKSLKPYKRVKKTLKNECVNRKAPHQAKQLDKRKIEI